MMCACCLGPFYGEIVESSDRANSGKEETRRVEVQHERATKGASDQEDDQTQVPANDVVTWSVRPVQ